MIQKKHLYFLWGISFFLLLFCLIGIETGYLALFDTFCYEQLMKVSSTTLTGIFAFFTNFGSLEVFLLLLLLFYFLTKDKKTTFFFFFHLVLLGIVGLLMKAAIARVRPSVFPIITELGYSFPSAHALLSSGFYCFLFLYWAQRPMVSWKKQVGLLVCFLFVLFIGISRIYLGVHYTTDVLAGFALGMLLVSMELLYFMEKRQKN